jgi:hypothetical protein
VGEGAAGECTDDASFWDCISTVSEPLASAEEEEEEEEEVVIYLLETEWGAISPVAEEGTAAADVTCLLTLPWEWEAVGEEQRSDSEEDVTVDCVVGRARFAVRLSALNASVDSVGDGEDISSSSCDATPCPASLAGCKASADEEGALIISASEVGSVRVSWYPKGVGMLYIDGYSSVRVRRRREEERERDLEREGERERERGSEEGGHV